MRTPKKPATLMTITVALGDLENLTGIRIVRFDCTKILFIEPAPGKFAPLDSVRRLEIRLALEVAGFRPVSARLLDEALTIAKFPRGERGRA
jgi:hypothetical protein